MVFNEVQSLNAPDPTNVVVGGITTVDSLVHRLKDCEPIFSTPVGMVNLVNREHWKNAWFPIVFKLLGKMAYSIDEQYANAPYPIVSTPLPNSTDLSFSHFANADVPISSTVSDMLTDSRFLNPENACVATVVGPTGMEMDVFVLTLHPMTASLALSYIKSSSTSCPSFDSTMNVSSEHWTRQPS